jgi:hypothetical protein
MGNVESVAVIRSNLYPPSLSSSPTVFSDCVKAVWSRARFYLIFT